MVAAQWRDEAGTQNLFSPAPLAVRWRPADTPVTDHGDNVGGALAGRSDEPARLAAAFRALPHRRLVVLGDPGAGKTTLAMLLVLALLDDAADPASEEPVPVLLSVASWNPHREHPRTWLTRRLREDYPGLADPSRRVDAAERLVTEHRVLPVLDGLDELPAPRRVTALAALNRSLLPGDPLVLTCRSSEYAVTVEAGEMLRLAAAVQAQPVRPEDALAHLQAAVPPHRLPAWQPVFNQLLADADAPVTATLSTPLAV